MSYESTARGGTDMVTIAKAEYMKLNKTLDYLKLVLVETQALLEKRTLQLRELENVNAEQYSRIKELEATVSKMENVGWVSVKDRIPKESDKDKFGYVLVMTSDGTCYTSEFDPEANDPYGTNDDCRWFTGDIYLNNVTHWMPLPTPPKEEK